MTGPLEGKRILLLEDEFLVALSSAQALVDCGADVAGPAYTIAAALELAQAGNIDGAVIDVNIGGESSSGVADLLREKGVPIVYATGYGVRIGVEGATVLDKPYSDKQLCKAVLAAMAQVDAA